MSKIKRSAALLLILMLFGTAIPVSGTSAPTEEIPEQTEAMIQLLSPENGATVSNSNATLKKWWDHYKKYKAKKITKKKAKYGTVAVVLKWKKIQKKSETYKVFISRNESFENAQVVSTKTNKVKLRNLYCNTKYYWKVTRGKTTSQTRWFYTKNMARVLRVKGVKNVRDIGGYTTSDGKVVRQGLVYRSGQLDKIKKSGKKTIKDTMKIKTELDLRALGEGNAGRKTKLAKKYVRLGGYSYESMWEEEEGTERIVEQMKIFANEKNYPILIHCIYGRDRTGTLALVLNGLLGVRKKDLYRDYEMTFFAQVPDRKWKKRMKSFDRTFRYLRKYKNKKKPLSYNIEAFLRDNGMTKKEISKIKGIMLIP